MDDLLSKLRIINFVDQNSLSQLRDYLRKERFTIFELDGEDVVDSESFFRKAVELFPQDPPLSGQPNWDAFTDSLWGGLDNLSKERVAIIWTKVEKMLQRGLPDLLISIESFQHLASTISTTEYGITCPVFLIVFLLGEGDNFKPLMIEQN